MFALADDNGDGELTRDEITKLQKGVLRSLQIGFKVGFMYVLHQSFISQSNTDKFVVRAAKTLSSRAVS